jgi:hypothetical protein
MASKATIRQAYEQGKQAARGKPAGSADNPPTCPYAASLEAYAKELCQVYPEQPGTAQPNS